MKQSLIASARKKILYLPHAIKQMSLPDRMITPDEVREAIFFGEVIEEYPDDRRGESCLIFHIRQSRPLHVVCAPKLEYLAVITAYRPVPEQWSPDFKARL